MIYFEINEGKEVSFIHHAPFDGEFGLKKTREELLKTGFLVEELPKQPEIGENQYASLRYINDELVYEMVTSFGSHLSTDDMKEKIMNQERELQETKQAIAELTMLASMNMLA